ncbi:MAG: diguanylate cyclase, partial [Pseudomonadota bacterium]
LVAPRDSSAREVIDSMEQGVIVWSADAICEMHNQRIFEVLELTEQDLFRGIRRRDFLAMAVARGEFGPEMVETAEARFQEQEPFSFDRKLPSGRIIATTARPKASGGFVVTFTDVTDARAKEAELAEAREAALSSERFARDALDEERARKEEEGLLSELGEWLQSCKCLDELLTVISRFMAKLFPGSRGELYIYSNSRDVLDGACAWNGADLLAHMQPDECWALRRGRLYCYGQGVVDFPCDHVSPGDDEEMPGYLCLPIIAHGDTVGLLHIMPNVSADETATSATEGAPAMGCDAVRDFAIRCAEQISLAIANVKLRDELRDQSTKDALTGLYNRRYFMERLRQTITNAEREQRAFSVLAIDFDKFKQLNDTHGHDAGDVVLRTISEQMAATFNGDDVAARFGGEEFAVLLTGTDREQAAKEADRLRSLVEEMVIRYGTTTLPKATISLGVAGFPLNGRTAQELLRSADEALYSAKDAGRNQTVLASLPASATDGTMPSEGADIAKAVGRLSP